MAQQAQQTQLALVNDAKRQRGMARTKAEAENLPAPRGRSRTLGNLGLRLLTPLKTRTVVAAEEGATTTGVRTMNVEGQSGSHASEAVFLRAAHYSQLVPPVPQMWHLSTEIVGTCLINSKVRASGIGILSAHAGAFTHR